MLTTILMPRNSSARFVLFTVACSALSLPRGAWAADADVRVSSIGYVAGRAKHASIVGAKSGTTFALKRDGDGSVVMSGTVAGPIESAETSESVAVADFTSMNEEGLYYLEVAGVGRSVTFPIGLRAFQEPFVASMLGFYGWRCGTAVSLTFHDTKFEHAACHTDDGHTDHIGGAGRRDGTKGWHDAGDYGKYVVNAGVTLGSMLAAWEQFSSALARISLPIPEKGGATPDYLDEIRWELEWLLTMQYSETDARVSHKLTSIKFDAEEDVWVTPEDDVQTRYFVPWGSAATADFVAMLAKAARIYSPYDAEFSRRCLDAARRSYDYLQTNAANVAPNQSAFQTGAYTTQDGDDRLWAAAELWETTGDGAVLADFENRAKSAKTKVAPDFDWGDVTNLGMFAYVLSQRAGRNPELVDELKRAAIGAADKLVANRAAHAYGRDLTEYYWGANGSVARTCMVLQTANLLSPKSEYLDTCVDQIAWLFGRNYYDRSFVTGVGKDPPMHPHHRPSAADGIDAPWPGLLVGGGHPTAKDWVDEEANYKVNEVAINWNSALVYALAAFVQPDISTSVTDAGSSDSSPADHAGGAAGLAKPDAGGIDGSGGRGSGSGNRGGGGGAYSGSGGGGENGAGSQTTVSSKGRGGSRSTENGKASGADGDSGAGSTSELPQPNGTSGCGCRMGGVSEPNTAPALLAAMAAGLLSWIRLRPRRRNGAV